MPVTYDFDGRLLALRMVGQYAPADIHVALVAGLKDSQAPAIQGLLFDVRGSEVLAKRSPQEVRAMAAFLAHTAPDFGSRMALVATSDVGFGLMRLGAVDVEMAGVAVQAFRDIDQALAWLRT